MNNQWTTQCQGLVTKAIKNIDNSVEYGLFLIIPSCFCRWSFQPSSPVAGLFNLLHLSQVFSTFFTCRRSFQPSYKARLPPRVCPPLFTLETSCTNPRLFQVETSLIPRPLVYGSWLFGTVIIVWILVIWDRNNSIFKQQCKHFSIYLHKSLL